MHKNRTEERKKLEKPEYISLYTYIYINIYTNGKAAKGGNEMSSIRSVQQGYFHNVDYRR